MEVSVTFRHVDPTPALKAYAEEKLVRLTKYLRRPVDAHVIAGESAVDQSPITGESIPVGKATGDTVFAGTINGHGLLRLQVERLAQESTLSKIIKIVEDARGQKSRTQRFTDKFEGTYAIGVMAASALAVIIPVLVFNQPFEPMFYRAMTLLVVASPCALVISTPASDEVPRFDVRTTRSASTVAVIPGILRFRTAAQAATEFRPTTG